MAREELEKAIEELGLTVEAVFVPWSKSRSYKAGVGPDKMNLNWKVTLKQGKRDILTTDYSAGLAHCPSYKQGERWTNDYAEVIRWECENGKAGRYHASLGRPGSRGLATGKAILPDACDVIWSLCSDSDVLTAGSFEEWAADFGYDTDSRKAEAIYRACVDTALKLVSRIGHEGLAKLQTAGEGY